MSQNGNNYKISPEILVNPTSHGLFPVTRCKHKLQATKMKKTVSEIGELVHITFLLVSEIMVSFIEQRMYRVPTKSP